MAIYNEDFKTYTYLVGNEKYSLGYFNPYITGFGLQEKNFAHEHGPILKPEHTLQYISEGEGYYRVNGKTYTLKAGDVFYLPKNLPVWYKAKRENPYTYYWLAFDGSGVEKFLNKLGFNKDNPVKFYGDNKITKMLKNIGEYLLSYNDVGFLSATGEALKLFAYLLSFEKQTTDYSIAEYHVENAIAYIKNYYYDGELNVTNLAKSMRLTRNYFCNIFTKITGQNPVEYLMDYRIEQAKKLLEMGAPVTQTAFDTGFNSSANFSVQFKNKVGVSPIKYRFKKQTQK